MKGFLLYLLFCVLVPYLLGSLSFSVIVSKGLYHQDIRKFGSGNAGMTNVLRTFGKKAAALTIVGDIGKGILAVVLAKWFFQSELACENSYFLGAIFGIYLAAFFAVIGHVYPLYFGFKGGKAVSVATGTIVAISPIMVLPLLVIFFGVLAIGKMVSLSSICCAAAYPIVTFLYYYLFEESSVSAILTATLGAAIMGGLVIWLHRSNIVRIRNGTEYKFFQKKK
ncbi:glycerol-3-phosphate 1-O-acyltransferase PlsY [uncultured Ruthenibacterium sp.]|uniref:glycerol-3-phosphate 1-O-acyltransferase PlsY n=1 Tax=uncultured Ruthenibacterium sp. TaxID=1905347 RepID=UPI00349E8FB9